MSAYRLPYSGAIRLAGRWLSGRDRLQRLIVLYYHRVLDTPDPLYPDLPDRERFRQQMEILSAAFRILPLDEAWSALRAGHLPPNAVAVTFDDGYADNYRVAFPILQQLGLQATFFVAPAYLDGGVMFNDQVFEACRHFVAGELETGLPEIGCIQIARDGSRRKLAEDLVARLKYQPPSRRQECAVRLRELAGIPEPSGLMMNSADVAALAGAGMTIGGHTWSHPILSELSGDEAAREISDGRDRLREITGRDVGLFAYPNGKPGVDYGPRDVMLVREAGFEAAFTTVWGCADRRWDPFQLPRVAPWDPSRSRFALRLLKCYLDSADIMRFDQELGAAGA